MNNVSYKPSKKEDNNTSDVSTPSSKSKTIDYFWLISSAN